MRIGNYFDNAATTPVDPRVVTSYISALNEDYGNANSIHELGRQARAKVEIARAEVAQLIGAEYPEEIVFLSGATEANNWVTRSTPRGAFSPFEHSSLLESAAAAGWSELANDGWKVLPNPSADTIAIMLVNNETGAILEPLASKQTGQILHVDVTQAAGKIPVDVSQYNLAAMSAHKIYGPKGIGILYAKDANFPESFILGGEQERGFRAGTLNAPAAIAFGVACKIATDERQSSFELAEKHRQVVLEELKSLSDWVANDHGAQSPYIISLSFGGVHGEFLVIEMDNQGYAISSGAACSSGSPTSSHVLTALGLDEKFIKGTVRISLGRFNSPESSQALGQTLAKTIENARNLA